MPSRELIGLANKNNYFGSVFSYWSKKFMERTAEERIAMFNDKLFGEKIIDVGLGSGAVSWLLKKRGYEVSSVDVENKSLYKEVEPKIYDGRKLPFKDKSFDSGLLLCVLHHCGKNQISVLKEAMRTCKRVVILEDTYRNRIERTFVSLRDMVGNFEFYDHNYRTVENWESVFKKNGWKVSYSKIWSNFSSYGMYGRQVLFVIDPS